MSKFINKKTQLQSTDSEVWKNYSKSLYLTFLKPYFNTIEEC